MFRIPLVNLGGAALVALLVLTACDVPATSPSPANSPAQSPAPTDACRQDGVTYCAVNPAVAQATIGQTICVSGWTATVRPPESYTENLKRQQIASEALPGGLSSYEEDHLISGVGVPCAA